MREYDSMLEIKPRLINHYKISMKQNEFDQYLYIIATIPASVPFWDYSLLGYEKNYNMKNKKTILLAINVVLLE